MRKIMPMFSSRDLTVATVSLASVGSYHLCLCVSYSSSTG